MTFFGVTQASIEGPTSCDTVCVSQCVSLVGSIHGHQRSELGVCGAAQTSASGAAAARTFCSAPTQDTCYQLFISPHTSFSYLRYVPFIPGM